MTPPVTLPYSMADVHAAKGTNGLTVASSFSGCGGSSIGWALAGFDGRYACEFDTHAANAYHRAFPDTHLDTRSITEVTGADIEQAAGGPVDVWEGSPPCSKFSRAGKGHKGWGKITSSDSSDKRLSNVEDLFFEWTRLLGELRPRAAVAENVTAMLTGMNKGYTVDVLARIRELGYQATIWKLNACRFGVPQIRRRVFFVAWDPARCTTPTMPTPLPGQITARQAIADLPTVPRAIAHSEIVDIHVGPTIGQYKIADYAATLHPGEAHSRHFSLGVQHPDRPAATLASMDLSSVSVSGTLHWDRPHRKYSIAELQRLSSFPDDYPWPAGSTWGQMGARLGNVVPCFLARTVAGQIAEALTR